MKEMFTLKVMMAMMIFPRQGLGTHSVPDIEVLSTDPPDLMPLTGESIFLLLISIDRS